VTASVHSGKRRAQMWRKVEGRSRPRLTLEPFQQFGIAGKRRGKTFTVTVRFTTYRSFMYRKADHVGLLSPDAYA
jgi:hypothetical protein